jgi:nicotinamide-nucleotide amidase
MSPMKSPKILRAEIIAIGSELLTPSRMDTNSLWLTDRLNALGIEVEMKSVIGDDETRLEQVIREALTRSDVVLTTGGLGPTEDDVTRKAVARALGRSLILDEAVLEQIRERFARRGVPMPAINERQALVIEGAAVLENKYGTAPGLFIEEKGKRLFLLPGPPAEMKIVFDQGVAPRLAGLSGGMAIYRRVIKISGMTESAVDQAIAPIYRRYDNPQTTILATSDGIELHLTARAETAEDAHRLLVEVTDQIEDKLGAHVYTTEGESLEEVVGRRLLVKRYTLAVAESCTGGLVAKRLTDVPGSSQYFRGGVVAYSDQAKVELLGVPRELLSAQGAVSRDVSEAMAAGVKQRLGSTLGLAVTGIAGPSGASPETPPGLVIIAFADDVHVESQTLTLTGDRERIRELAAMLALSLLSQRLL